VIIILYCIYFSYFYILDSDALTPELRELFRRVKENNELLQPCVPGLAIAKLVTGTIPKEQNGQFVNWDVKF
jgi:hypothetical protein